MYYAVIAMGGYFHRISSAHLSAAIPTFFYASVSESWVPAPEVIQYVTRTDLAKETPTGIELDRSGVKVHEIEEDDSHWLSESLRSHADQKLKEGGLDGAGDMAAKQLFRISHGDQSLNYGQLFDRSPATKLLATIIKGQTGTKIWPNIAHPNRLTVFSNHAVPGEYPLQKFDVKWLQNYEKEQAKFDRVKIPSNVEVGNYQAETSFRSGDKTVQIGIERRQFPNFVWIRIFNDLGALEANGGLRLESAEAEATTIAAPQLLIDLVGKTLDRWTVRPELRPLPNPTTNDPLTYQVAPACKALANALGYSHVVASLPDDLIDLAFNARKKTDQLDLGKFKALIESRGDMEVAGRGDVLVIRPRHALSRESLHANRKKLWELGQMVEKTPYDVRHLCQLYNFFGRDAVYHPVVSRYFELYSNQRGQGSNPIWAIPASILAFFGSLEDENWKRISVGEPISKVFSGSDAALQFLFESRQREQVQPKALPPKDGYTYVIDSLPVENVIDLGAPISKLEATPTHILHLLDGSQVSMDGALHPTMFVLAESRKSMTATTRENGRIVTRQIEKYHPGGWEESATAFGVGPTDPSTLSEASQSLRRALDEKYRYYWRSGALLDLKVRFGTVASITPARLRAFTSPPSLEPLSLFDLPKSH